MAEPAPAFAARATAFLSPGASAVTVRIGGLPAQVAFAGNVTPGLCQINAIVPDVLNGDAVLSATIGSVSTPEVKLAVSR